MRYCSIEAFFVIQEINIGMTADVGTFPRLVKLIPEGLVREMAYTGRRMSAQEAAAAGFTWIPVLTNPGCYYFSFVITAALLGRRRPRIALGLLAASLAWLLGGLAFYLQNAEYVLASAVALVFSVFVLLELRRYEWTPR